ncbi:alpha/beta fold hydrolase [Kutzneria chonburiensis]|uniref:Alpha/beta fold hydrolase n=1 Tax=Kutzneria chonburiensis TaxID=1483604 RepID=A0ABV6MQT9_9PSEU|nr:alpha/beta fold hydrolase [Kutzneria chonburiensis]
MSGTTLPGRLITLVRRKDRPVCVMLPGAGGGLTPYLRLASHLGRTHSVYAVRAAGLLPDETPEDTVARMADSAVDALGGLAPALVFGWSLGGTVAWEVCLRLADRGLRPDLVIVDSSPLPRKSSAEDDERVRASVVSGLGPRPDEQTSARVERTVRAQMAALADYAATREYGGRVLLLMCPDDTFAERAESVHRWHELAPDLRSGTLDADHYAVFDPANLPQLTDAIGDFLGHEKAEATT